MGSNEQHLSTHLQSELIGQRWTFNVGVAQAIASRVLDACLVFVKYKVNVNSFVFNSVDIEFTLLFFSFTAG